MILKEFWKIWKFFDVFPVPFKGIYSGFEQFLASLGQKWYRWRRKIGQKSKIFRILVENAQNVSGMYFGTLTTSQSPQNQYTSKFDRKCGDPGEYHMNAAFAIIYLVIYAGAENRHPCG